MSILRLVIPMESTCHHRKPNDTEIAEISNELSCTTVESTVKGLALSMVQPYGHSWCPAIFNNEKRNNKGFQKQQLFALDFDKGIT